MKKTRKITHLSQDAREALNLGDDERISRVVFLLRFEAWIPYPRAKAILGRLEELFNLPRPRQDLPKSYRIPNLLMISDTNNGKTHLLNRFYDLHPKENNPDADAIYAPVIIVEVDSPSLDNFYNLVLMFLGAVFREKDRVEVKAFQTLKLMRQVGTRILIIDELSTAIAGTSLKQRTFLNGLKYLGNRSHVSIVGAGTREVFSALRLVPQLDNRFERAELKRWEFGADFRKLLESFEYILPLRNPSELQEPTLAMKLFSMTEGYIGELSNLLMEAAAHAIRTGSEKIDHKLLKQIAWKAPSERLKNL
jgi:hypothetical protein